MDDTLREDSPQRRSGNKEKEGRSRAAFKLVDEKTRRGFLKLDPLARDEKWYPSMWEET